MARQTNRLTDTWLKKKDLPSGVYGDGGSLYLRVQGTSKSWLFIYTMAGKRREMGLGAYPDTSLATAREKARTARDQRAKGIDPLVDKHKVAPPTFAVVAEDFIKANESGWSSGVAARYRSYVENKLGALKDMSVDKVDTAHVVQTLKPVWPSPTGDYLRSLIERTLDYATVAGHRPVSMNPARYRGHIQHLLPAGKVVTKHHASMPWQDVPKFYQSLPNTIAGRMLKLIMLTACRNAEIRFLKGHEVLPDRIVIGAERYKTRKAHAVPLAQAAQSLVVPCEPEAYVFPGKGKGRPQGEHAFDDLLPKGVTCHGFRTSFAVWAVEQGGFTDELAQRCLGHVVGSATTRSYQRSDFFEQRKALHDAWKVYLTT